jgi:hypothetical protein
MSTPARLDARLFIHAQHVIFRPQRLAFPKTRIQIENRPGLLSEPRVLRKEPMLVLPRLDGCLVQHPPNGTAADLFAQGRLRPSHQIGKGLPAQRFFGFGDHFTRHSVDQGLIQRGKKLVCIPVQADRQWKNRHWPSAVANVALDAAKGRPSRRRPRCARWAAHEAATPGNNAEPPESRRSVVEPCRVHLARIRPGTYNEQALDLAWRLPFLAGLLGIHLLIPKVYPNHDVICETDHLAWCDAKPPTATRE